jgi:predicted CopG family antitoxin
MNILLNMKTTITINKETVDKLKKLKVHPRQPYEEVVSRLLNRDEIRYGDTKTT